MQVILEPLPRILNRWGFAESILMLRIQVQLEKFFDAKFMVFWVAKKAPGGRISGTTIVGDRGADLVDEFASKSSRPMLNCLWCWPIWSHGIRNARAEVFESA